MKSLFSLGFIFTALFAFAQDASACSCAPLGQTFGETVLRHNAEIESGKYPAEYKLTVVKATVVEYLKLRSGAQETEMAVDVSEVLQGKVSTKRIVIEGDNGMQCRPYVNNFGIGKIYLLAIHELKGATSPYAISGCGVYSEEVTE